MSTNLIVGDDSEIIHGDAFDVLVDLANQNKTVDHVITDPPYNISKPENSVWGLSGRSGLDFGEWDYGFDVSSWIPLAANLLAPAGSFIVFTSYQNFTPIIDTMTKCGLVVKDVIRWIKASPMPRNINRRYVVDAEFAIWAVGGGDGKWVFNLPSDVKYLRPEFRYGVPSGNNRKHPTQKSLPLMQDIISIHSNPGDTILDPFMGSGTTGEASLLLGRKFIGIEKDDDYYNIACERLTNIIDK